MGFHAGELAVQHQAGVADEAARLSGMLAPVELRGGIVRLLAHQTFAAMTARDDAGRLWISPLAGPQGFLSVAGPTTLEIDARPVEGDPLHEVTADQSIGLLVIDFAARRRIRINGQLTATTGDRLRVEVEQAYGNCPRHIHPRLLEPAPTSDHQDSVRRGTTLTVDDQDLIRSADTLLLGTTHPTRGNDASHRGGSPGFVRAEGNDIWWPDYAGNNLFNSLGNIATDADTALLFADYDTGRTLHLSGTSTIEWSTPTRDDPTGRHVHFTTDHLVSGDLLAVHAV